ncbi:MAG: hypothetical protein WA700_13805 [Acidobacteriaceae bacterium]
MILPCFFAAALLLPCMSFASDSGDSNLPDAPQPTAAATAAAQPATCQASPQVSSSTAQTPAPRLAKYIGTDQTTVRLSAKEKLELSGWEQLQPYAFITQLWAAGWEQWTDTDPQYGTDGGAFGERLGAAALLQNTRAVLSDGIMASIFRQDPRYYRQGHRPIKQRIYHAVERVFIIRSDDGTNQANYSQLLGNAVATALTMTYYPAVSATWSKTAKGYGVSLAEGALGNEIHEFTPGLERLAFHHHD